jgi:molybdenum-dependent DNA-binding transcriptional regulator ModE
MKDHWREAFLTGLENTGSVTEAAKAAGISRTPVHHQCKRTDPLFAKEWEESLRTKRGYACR